MRKPVSGASDKVRHKPGKQKMWRDFKGLELIWLLVSLTISENIKVFISFEFLMTL